MNVTLGEEEIGHVYNVQADIIEWCSTEICKLEQLEVAAITCINAMVTL